MSITNIKEIAQQIIDETASIVAPNTVNLMDQDGYIVASSDIERIGTFHSGALQAIKEKKEIDITPQEISHYKGAKQGVNIPIIKNGEAIAVIGIYGNPDEVRKMAYLLSISTSLFFDQAEKMQVEQRKKKLRSSLSQFVLEKESSQDFFDIALLLGTNLKFPLNLILFSFEQTDLDYDKIYHQFRKNGLLKVSSDLLLKFQNCFLLIKSNDDISYKYMKDNLTDLDIPVKTVVYGEKIKKIEKLHDSFNVCRYFTSLPYQRKMYDVGNFDDLTLLAYCKNAHEYLHCITERMIKALDNYTSFWIYETIEEYLNQDGRIQCVADSLNIHKNTCIYRVNKILNICKLDNCKSMTIFYFLSSILYSKKSAKADKQ